MSVVCFGELLIDFMALESGVEVGSATGFLKAPGGAPANVAVAVKRLGHPSAFIGQVGDDPFGRYLEGVLRHEGVDTRGLRFSSQARTALAFVALGEDGERTFTFYRNPSADMLMRPEDVDISLIDEQRVLHFGSITLIDEPSRSATLTAVEHAAAAGLLVSYDPNLRLALWPDEPSARAGMLSGMQYAHVVKVTHDELEFMTGSSDPMALWRPQMKLLAITRGREGATLFTQNQVIDLPGFTVNSVDTTGAGDGFVAGLLSGILEQGDELRDRLVEIGRFACAVGALATTRKGAIPGLPTRQQVLTFLGRQ